MSSSKIIFPWKRCSSKNKKKKTKRVKSCVAFDNQVTKTADQLLPPLKRCKSVVKNENMILLCPLKSCKYYGQICEGDSDVDPGSDIDLPPPRKLKSTHLDVLSLLSNNCKTTYLVRSNAQFVGLDFVLGKNLVICCLPLPVDSNDDEQLRAMIATYSELPRPDFELVLVISTNNKADFLKFFSADIPCLTIPFSDFSTRASVCSFIGPKPGISYWDFSAIFVDATRRVLHNRGTSVLLNDYGSEWLGRNEDDIETQDDILRSRLDPIFRYGLGILPEAVKMDPLLDVPLSLHKDILLCSPSQKLSRLEGVGAGQSSLMVSELSNKCVGLYLCMNMVFLEQLHKVHQQCVANNQELEIVLVCKPLFEDSKSFHKPLIKALKRYKITSWFIFPYDHKVCRRLWRIFALKWSMDKFIILPPNCTSGELEGRTVVEQIGMKAYPFTRSTILEQRLSYLKSLTPTSWFKGTCKESTCLFRNGAESSVSMSEITGRKLLLYLDWLRLSNDRGELCRLLIEHYSEIQAMGCEVVFVPLDCSDTHPHHVQLAEMPWPIMPVTAAVQASVARQLVFRYELHNWRCRTLFAVGEDGKILATLAQIRLKKFGVSDHLFHDKLHEDISAQLCNLECDDID